MSRTGDRRSAASGFTLIEVLVAMVVAAILLGIVVDGVVPARSRQLAALDERRAVLLASELIETERRKPFKEGVQQGRRNDLSWTRQDRLLLASPQQGLVLVGIELAIRASNGRRLLQLSARQLRRRTSS